MACFSRENIRSNSLGARSQNMWMASIKGCRLGHSTHGRSYQKTPDDSRLFVVKIVDQVGKKMPVINALKEAKWVMG